MVHGIPWERKSLASRIIDNLEMIVRNTRIWHWITSSIKDKVRQGMDQSLFFNNHSLRDESWTMGWSHLSFMCCSHFHSFNILFLNYLFMVMVMVMVARWNHYNFQANHWCKCYPLYECKETFFGWSILEAITQVRVKRKILRTLHPLVSTQILNFNPHI